MSAQDHRARLEKALLAIEKLQARVAEAERGASGEPIAVVGMACRLPGSSNDPDAFRALLREGRDAIREAPPERFSMDGWYDPDPEAPGKSYVRRAGFIDRADHFDPGFFGIAPREALSMDPQHRLLLETAWAALEDAGIVPASLQGTRTAAIIGITGSEYAHRLRRAGVHTLDAYQATGCTPAFSAGRLSYVLGLAGPSFAVDTACSSSLVAVHTACVSLRSGESDLAMAAGVNVMAGPEMFVPMSKARMLSPDARCATFDAAANGFARGEGCGVVVLRRLSDAVAAGDRILAVVRGSAINQDGATSGMTVPNRAAQETVIRAALESAGVEPYDIGYVEAHGTGTPLGDPIEIAALAAVLGAKRSAPLYVGSVKTNFGHLEAAAGIAGFMKAVLAVRDGEIHPHLHFREPSPHIAWSEIPVRVPAALQPWEGRRVAGVSSFGASGTNAHVIVEAHEPAPRPAPEVERPLHVITLSARTEAELDAQIERVAACLADDELADIAHTTNAGRTHFPHRVAARGATADELRTRLLGSGDSAFAVRGHVRPGTAPKIAFLFSGQGAQHVGMGARLYAIAPAYREGFDRCDEILRPHLGGSLADVVMGDSPAERLDETGWTQPALFALEYALAELWRSWGIQPAAVLGHSVGEIVAACVAGAVDLEDGLAFIAERASLMQSLPSGGAMAAALAPADVVAAAIERSGADVSIAAMNAPANTVISGAGDAVEAVASELKAAGIDTRALRVSHAFHSALMDPVLGSLERAAAAATWRSPRVPLVSNLTGRSMNGELLEPSYWSEHARRTVRFADGVRELAALGCDTFLEIGPHPVLLALGRETLAGDAHRWLASLRRGGDDAQEMFATAQRLHVAGAPIDWQTFDRGTGARRVALPTYPFRGTRFWVEIDDAPAAAAAGKPTGHALLGAEIRTAAATRIFETHLSAAAIPLLAEHRIRDAVVVSATTLIEMMRAAAARVFGEQPLTLRDVLLSAPLVLPNEGAKVQVLVESDGRVAVHSWTGDAWQPHARALAAPGADTADHADLPSGEPVDVAALYDRLARGGVGFGPSFRALETLSSDGTQTAAHVRFVDRGWGLDPAGLDACFQAAVPLLPDALMVPAAAERIAVRALPSTDVRCRASVRSGASAHGATVDLVITDAAGRVLIEIEGLALRSPRTGPAEAPIYDLSWQTGEESASAAGAWQIIGGPADFRDALMRHADATMADPTAIDAGRGIVFLRALEYTVPRDADARIVEAAQKDVLGSLLELVRTLVENGPAVPLTIVTRNSSATDARTETADPLHAAVRGFARVVAAEHPELRVRIIDIGSQDAAALARELGCTEPEVALRPRGRLVPRLARRPAARPDSRTEGPVRLVADGTGTLDGLKLVAAERRAPAPDEVEVRVEAAGIGFRDVLGALGAYPGEAPSLGSDFAGIVVRAGANADLAPGDRVAGFAEGAFGSYVTVAAWSVAQVPDDVSLLDAAALPSPFGTALYALENVAGLKSGERVLVHAGAGGVGLAAIQVAQRIGAEVFATAGSAAKRAYLRTLGVENVYDSRALDFADGIRADTQGAGVHVVLNSLSGEAIDRSLEALARDGRFVELGKRGIRTPEEVAGVRPDVRYTIVDLGVSLREDPALARTLLARSMTFEALPRQTYALTHATAAFRAMAEARHIGRIVLVPPCTIRADATYLVTGGAGGIGPAVVQWLADRGARTVVVTARTAPSQATRDLITELSARGVRVITARADAADARAMADLLARIEAELPPLAGVLHLAGANDDGAVARQTWERVAAVLRGKARGGLLLERLLGRARLDFVIHFGSAATVFSARGQSAYAAANAFLEALATRAHNAPTVTIAWGPWSGAGMAARAPIEGLGRGLRALSPEVAARALDEILAHPEHGPFAAVIDADWNALAAERALPPMFSNLATATVEVPAARATAPAFRPTLDGAPGARRRGLLISHLRGLAVRVLSLDPQSALEADQPLSELGMDSLMAIELRNLIGTTLDLERPLSATAALDYPTLGALADHVLERLYPSAPPAHAETAAIAELSDEEAEAALLAELDEAGMVEP